MEYYVATIDKEDGTNYGVSFHDFPGCVSAGETLGEAAENAKEALALHIEGMLEDKESIPEPSAMEVVQEHAGGSSVYALVPADVELGQTVRVNITINDRLLKHVDKFSDELGMKRSAFLAAAAKDYMNKH